MKIWLTSTSIFKVNLMVYWLKIHKKSHNLETMQYIEITA